jgi:hypothetical protein
MTKIIVAIAFTAGLLVAGSLSSCYYDNTEDLLGANACDTSAVSYSADIVPILQGSCYVCHGTASYSASGGGILVEGYDATAALATSGLLTAVVDWEAGASAMPKSAPKLPSCDRALIRNWVNQGALNN